MDYEDSCELARKAGYIEVKDEKAFKSSYFIKDGKKWIHDVCALMVHLGITKEKELEKLGYDLEGYYSRQIKI